MTTMSIDASSKSTGIAIFKDEELIHYECITATESDSIIRIKKITNRIIELAKNFKPNLVIMEDVIPEDVSQNQKTFKTLHYLQGFIVINLHDIVKDIKFFTSSEWRSKCGIKTGRYVKRNELKQASMNLVKDKYNINVNDDVSDAICIGLAYLTKEEPKVEKKKCGFELVVK